MIKLQDKIWGDYNIKEPILIDLIESKTIKRLKNIHQGGATFLILKGRDGSRFSHSVGVMLLIRFLNGSIKEQVAGLLHDISHTAFSHVIDQVFENRKETFHEEKLDFFLNHSDVPGILDKHGFDLEEIMNEKNWGILEQSQPDICADRVDYTLRDLYEYGQITDSDIELIKDNLDVKNGKMIFQDVDAALRFTHLYYKEVTELFMSPKEIFANNHLARAIRIGIEKEILTSEDMLLKDDVEIFEILRISKEPEILDILNDLNFELNVCLDEANYSYKGFSKARVVDPLIKQSSEIKRLSAIKPEVNTLHQNVRNLASRGIYVRLIN